MEQAHCAECLSFRPSCSGCRIVATLQEEMSRCERQGVAVYHRVHRCGADRQTFFTEPKRPIQETA